MWQPQRAAQRRPTTGPSHGSDRPRREASIRAINAHSHTSLLDTPTLFLEFQGSEAALKEQRVTRAVEVARQVPRLSINDGFAFALAERHAGCVLLSGEGALRTHAAACSMEVRGVLWVIDELHGNGIAPVATLLDALALFEADDSVRLPAREISAAIRRYLALK